MTARNPFNNDYDALSIFIDQQDEAEGRLNLKQYMKALYAKQRQQFLYKKTATITGSELFNYIYREQNEMNIILPPNQRMLFCYYLPLEKLSDEWVENYFETAKTLQEMHPVLNAFDHHFMLAFNYSVASQMTAEKKEEAIRCIQRIVREHTEISKNIYLLRVAGFDSFDRQEKGLLQLLHILSRKDYFNLTKPLDPFQSHLKILAYNDYYVNQAIECNATIDRVKQWFEGRFDPELTEVRDALVKALAEPCDTLRNEIRNQERKEGLYPISVNNYQTKFLWMKSRKDGDYTRILSKRREDSLNARRADLTEKTDLSEVLRIVTDELFYNDYPDLQEKLKNGVFADTVVERVANAKGLSKNNITTDNISMLVRQVCERLKGQVEEICKTLPETAKDKEMESKNAQRELSEAGKYSSLEGCFAKIEEDTKVHAIGGVIAPVNTDEMALISDQCSDIMFEKGLNIAGVPVAYRYNEIAPKEIVMLKECDMFDIMADDAADNLRIVL